MNYSITVKIISIIILIISLIEVMIGFLLFVSDIYINKYVSEMTESVIIGESTESIMDEFDDDDDIDWDKDKDVLKKMYSGYIENTKRTDTSFMDFINKLRFIAVMAGSITVLTGILGIIMAVLGFLPPRARRLNFAFCLGVIRTAFSIVFVIYQLDTNKTINADVLVTVCILLYLLCIYKIKKQVKSEEELIENADGLEEVVDLIE